MTGEQADQLCQEAYQWHLALWDHWHEMPAFMQDDRRRVYRIMQRADARYSRRVRLYHRAMV